MTAVDTLLDLARNLLPPNLIQVHISVVVLTDASHCRMSKILKKESFFTKMFSLSLQAGIQQYRTVLKYPGNEEITESNGQTRVPDNLYTWKIGGEYTSGTNILGLVFFSVVLGITLAIMEEKGKPLIDFFTCLSEGRTKKMLILFLS